MEDVDSEGKGFPVLQICWLRRILSPILNLKMYSMKPLTRLLGFVLILSFLSCTKTSLPPSGTPDPIADETLPQVAKVQLINNAFTDVSLVINDLPQLKALAPKTASYITGKPGDIVRLQMETVSRDENGNPVGLTITLEDEITLPAAGEEIVKNINIPAEYFFVAVLNQSNGPVNQVVVNELTPEETSNEITIFNDGKPVGCGYYIAPVGFTNIKVARNKGPYAEWVFPQQKLPGAENQFLLVRCQ